VNGNLPGSITGDDRSVMQIDRSLTMQAIYDLEHFPRAGLAREDNRKQLSWHVHRFTFLSRRSRRPLVHVESRIVQSGSLTCGGSASKSTLTPTTLEQSRDEGEPTRRDVC
jgi:hypothetical protein